MNWIRPFFLLVCLSLQSSLLLAQVPHKISPNKLVIEDRHDQYSQGRLGIKLTFDIEFNWMEGDFFNQMFDVEYRIQQGDKVLPGSRGSIRKASNVSPNAKTDSKGMKESRYSLFIPYSEIPLETGTQELQIYFSLYNKTGQYPDCFMITVKYQHEKIVQYGLDQQVFSFSKVEVEHNYKPFESSTPAFLLKSTLTTAHGPKNSKESSYSFSFKLTDMAGKTIYDSEKQANSMNDRQVTLAPVENGEKGEANFRGLVEYEDIQAEGPTKAQLKLFLQGTENGPKLVHSENLELDLPLKYNFNEQVFSTTDLVAKAATVDGVQGIEVQFKSTAKYSTFLRNPEKGKFYFYPLLFDQGNKQVIMPERSPKNGSLTTQLMHGFLPEPGMASTDGRLFIPFFLLNLPSGNQVLELRLMVSDLNLGTKFPVLGQTSLTVAKPKEQKWRISVEEITMVDGNYDADLLGFASRLPELQYTICLGRDRFYESDYTKNSLSAQTGSTTLIASEGDEIYLVLYDVDSGFFNNDDSLGKWLLAYAKGAQSLELKIENQGQVVRMHVTGKVL